MNDRPPASRGANSCLGPGRSYVTDPGTVYPMSRRTVSRILHRVDIGFEYTKIGRHPQFAGRFLTDDGGHIRDDVMSQTLTCLSIPDRMNDSRVPHASPAVRAFLNHLRCCGLRVAGFGLRGY
jgi:hypothetical protein